MKKRQPKAVQIQNQEQIQLQSLDNAVHRFYIGLERLEDFLEITDKIVKNADTDNFEEIEKESNQNVRYTAKGTDRDWGGELESEENGYHAQLLMNLMTLGVQQKRDAFTQKIFLQDILEWYSYRAEKTPNNVDAYMILFLFTLFYDKTTWENSDDSSEQRKVFNEKLTSLFNKYIVLPPPLELNDDKQKDAILEGFEAMVKSEELIKEQWKQFENNGSKAKITSHTRGNALAGYQHLIKAFEILYADDVYPIQFLKEKVEQNFTEGIKKKIVINYKILKS